MNSIKTKIKKVNNLQNKGKKIFFCVDDILNILEIPKTKWVEEWELQKQYISDSLKKGEVEFHIYYTQNYFIENIVGMNENHESLYCTLDILMDILDFEDGSKLLALLGVE